MQLPMSLWFLLTIFFISIDLVMIHVGRDPVTLAVFYQPFELFPCATSKESKHSHEK